MKLILHKNKWWWGESIHLIANNGKASVELSLQNEYPEHGYIGTLIVLKGNRRQSYASVLMKAVEDIARRKGLHYLYLGVGKESPKWLIEWYQRLGFEPNGDMEESDGHSWNYQKDLTKERDKTDRIQTRITDLPFSVRSLGCLKAAGVETLEDLLHVGKLYLLKRRNFGKKSAAEIETWLHENGYDWGNIVDTDDFYLYKKEYELIDK